MGFNRSRLFFEFGIPTIITILILLIFHLSGWSLTNILDRIKEINGHVATIIALQIGFNITSLALISTFNSDILKNTFSKVAEEKKEQALKQLIASFVYCILVQTWIIIFGVVYNTSYQGIIELNRYLLIKPLWQTVIVFGVFFIWMISIIHSLIVFYRNVTLIYKFILINVRK